MGGRPPQGEGPWAGGGEGKWGEMAGRESLSPWRASGEVAEELHGGSASSPTSLLATPPGDNWLWGLPWGAAQLPSLATPSGPSQDSQGHGICPWFWPDPGPKTPCRGEFRADAPTRQSRGAISTLPIQTSALEFSSEPRPPLPARGANSGSGTRVDGLGCRPSLLLCH